MHYNIYLGIDEVSLWPWVFVLPGVAFLVALLDVIFALGIFRRDALASRMLLAVCLASTMLWSVGSFFLVLVNT
jgi:hypothetical protein